ncbi:GNAT family N-acetyltransferase [Corynebacterium kozikiae]|uniref:GNAT family N-acetyltransferase n=1 Tax=Corynebacterium kozikiae TaxID=2968469 RepID=UPI00211CD1B7|nr:GNAT family N-acetyltransferase [Corynebacterium sp. 76QC2CO]MCQ9342764.1 GNAT family N-acetyltransferase [Corynebacterium sp. 76QC2CO]
MSQHNTNVQGSPTIRVRPARREDTAAMVQFVKDLAVYEKEPLDTVRLTEATLEQQLFGEHPAIFAHIAEEIGADGSASSVGFALWFLNYSTWEGAHGIYLEDLFVHPEHRGKGAGKALLKELAGIAVERGYKRVEWSVLKWNTPSIEFYRSIGAFPMEEWNTYRLTGGALTQLGG